jgi:hypothetical protein
MSDATMSWCMLGALVALFVAAIAAHYLIGGIAPAAALVQDAMR